MLVRVNLVPGYRAYLEYKTGVKTEGTPCYLCGRVRNATRDGAQWPVTVSQLHMDHIKPLESDDVTEESPWARIVTVTADSEWESGPRSKREWEVRQIDHSDNFAPICTQCNNLKGARSCERFPTTAEQSAVAAFHIAKAEKNAALYHGKTPVLGEMPEALANKYRAKARKEYRAMDTAEPAAE